jgi:glutamine synthetase
MEELKSKNDVLKVVKERGIRFIELWFTDISGFLKSFTITVQELDKAFDEGIGFDGSSVEGFVRIEESDTIAIPDPTTFTLLPWETDGFKTARMFCDIYLPEGQPFEGDPRYVLKRNLDEARKLGFTFHLGPELEFFYFKTADCPEILDRGGYFDLTPRDEAIALRQKTVVALEKMGIEVEFAHHEVAPSQHEIDLKYDEALKMADKVMTYRFVVKEIAYRNGVYATFMPKPLATENGSGMHTHMSLFKNGKNAFFDAQTSDHLSETARSFVAGLMKHAPEFTAVTNQWVNSYKRLVPGYEAPVYITWARKNRSDMIRVPMYKPGKEEATRIELRSPDPACNPYLAFSVILAAGLEGINKNYELPEPVEENVYLMSPKERERKGIKTLPGSLVEAIKLAENSELVKKALGDHVFHHFIQNKKAEWEKYRCTVTSYELNEYLPLL